MTTLQINAANLIKLPLVDSKENFLGGFWKWVEILAAGNYSLAVESLYWQRKPIEAPALEERLTTFLGVQQRLVPVIPNERLIGVVNDAAQVEWRNGEGWGLAQIPLTNDPHRCKEDDVMLMGAAVSFFMRRCGADYVLEFEVFHA